MPLARQDKIIAAIMVFLSLVGGAAEIFRGLDSGFATVRVLTSAMLVVIGLAGAYGSLKGRRSGALLGSLFFLAQIPQVEDSDFAFSLSLEPMLVISAASADSGMLGVNLVAVVMFLWSSIRLASSDSPIREASPQRAMPNADPRN